MLNVHFSVRYVSLMCFKSSSGKKLAEKDIYQEPCTTFTGCLLIQANLMNHSRKDKEKFLIDGMGNNLPRCKEVKRLAQIWL